MNKHKIFQIILSIILVIIAITVIALIIIGCIPQESIKDPVCSGGSCTVG